jgi:cytochrome c-type biogenesis protein CcmH
MNDTLSALRAQLQQLKALHSEGSLSAEAYDKARAPLERQLLDSVMAAPPATPGEPAQADHPRTPVRLTALLGVAVLALAGAGYWWTGSPGAPSASTPGATRSAAATDDGVAPPHSESDNEQQFAAAVAQLAEKLKKQPDNAEGWAMLARSYARLGRHAEAVPAYEKAVAQNGGDARLLADYADTLAVQNNRSLTGAPMKLVERALKIDPNSPKALALAGTDAFERKDFPVAVRYWEKLAQGMPADSAFMPELQSSIAQARELGGMPKAATTFAAATPAVAAPATPAPAPAPTQAGAAPGPAALQGSVRLSPAMAKLASPTDTVFIFARAAEGPRMPLAILRMQVKDLPLKFTLDDSTAMSPATRLSQHPRVVVSARVSKSGQATPAPGDLVGQSAPVDNTAGAVDIEINELAKP